MIDQEIKMSHLFETVPPYLISLFESCEYPWEMIPKIKEFLSLMVSAPMEGFTFYADGVLMGKNVKIADSAVIEAPAIIADDCQLRPNAYIRGNVIAGRGCVIGNSSELKNCILLDGVQLPHYNYVGDSILGNFAHMGAGAVLSNLKSDKSDVVVKGCLNYKTGLRKFGAILGDRADIGCGCVLNPGTIIGKNTSVYPLTSLRGVIPEDSIVKSSNDIIKKRRAAAGRSRLS